jgi:hypothetical protein
LAKATISFFIRKGRRKENREKEGTEGEGKW